MCRRISQRVLRCSTEDLRQRHCRRRRRCCPFTGNWWRGATRQSTGGARTNTQKYLARPQSYPQSLRPTISQVGTSILWKTLWWIIQLWGATWITDILSFSADSYGRNSVRASHRKPVKDLYKLGFIITSVCGGLLFILTLYCLITQKVAGLLFC